MKSEVDEAEEAGAEELIAKTVAEHDDFILSPCQGTSISEV